MAQRFDRDHPRYKWVALSNTTVGMLLATVNSSIVIISLPAIFNGIHLGPLAPGNVSYRDAGQCSVLQGGGEGPRGRAARPERALVSRS